MTFSTHWTYCPIESGSDLQQGDIIGRTDELLAILRGVHSYFCDDKYIAFLVVTQSCDLVRRSHNGCKAPQITIATVRELDQVLPGMIQELCGAEQTSILLQERKDDARQFLKRVIDQNEQSRGLFYLHPAADAGIAVASLAFLRVTITLRQEHYSTLMQSRVGRLQPEFANKLGWLVGNLYSRIGTPDWSEKADPDMEKQLVSGYINDAAPENRWVPEAWVRGAKSKRVDLNSLTQDPASNLRQYAPPSAMEIVLKELALTAIEIRIGSISEAFRSMIRRDQTLLELVVDDLVAKLVGAHIKADILNDIRQSLCNSDEFTAAVANWCSSIIGSAKKFDTDDPFKKAIDFARGANIAIPPVLTSFQKALTNLSPDRVKADLSDLNRPPVLSSRTVDRIAALLAELGNDRWFADLQKLKARLSSNTKFESQVR